MRVSHGLLAYIVFGSAIVVPLWALAMSFPNEADNAPKINDPKPEVFAKVPSPQQNTDNPPQDDISPLFPDDDDDDVFPYTTDISSQSGRLVTGSLGKSSNRDRYSESEQCRDLTNPTVKEYSRHGMSYLRSTFRTIIHPSAYLRHDTPVIDVKHSLNMNMSKYTPVTNGYSEIKVELCYDRTKVTEG
ncbi:hypothetical protein BJ085DRAFT_29474 [Dimargaris cristalligena]|uniref:Uncharacterized protein n=1 Tax=Dimargaris cristalligena TaxID=215637 RepID=A0A4P9ZSM3_9FUNG|nr:hypothetical protein BJ085DRAFT_29474 [Dimargaris cristalligena]|eukprot:RKP35480.1 hypothetical protein BJ085DRAFT_29474 [Dimargaris cristalligena]